MIKYARSSYIRRNDWQTQKRYGGGMLNNYGAHAIDQLLYITGSKAADISCRLRRIATLGDADDVVKAVIETDNGIILDIDINMAIMHKKQDSQKLSFLSSRNYWILMDIFQNCRETFLDFYNLTFIPLLKSLFSLHALALLLPNAKYTCYLVVGQDICTLVPAFTGIK